MCNVVFLICVTYLVGVVVSDSDVLFCRYGLPVTYQSVLMHPHKKHTKKLMDTLTSMFRSLDSTSSNIMGSSEVGDTETHLQSHHGSHILHHNLTLRGFNVSCYCFKENGADSLLCAVCTKNTNLCSS